MPSCPVPGPNGRVEKGGIRMNIARNKLLAIGGAVMSVVVIAGVILAVQYVRDPMRTPMPDKGAPIAAIQAQMDKLKPVDRRLLIGYLLLQRGEIPSLSTQGIGFTAKTFREAIAAQNALLDAKQVSAEWPLMRALETQALRPLREAVPLELTARRQTTPGELFLAKKGNAVVVMSGGRQDEARTAMFYRIRNAGQVAITHLTGYIQPQLASDDWINTLAQNAGACRVEVNNLAPGATAQVICAQLELNAIGDASKTPDDKLLIDWRPDLVEYADGSKLAYDVNASTDTLFWNRYTIDGDIR